MASAVAVSKSAKDQGFDILDLFSLLGNTVGRAVKPLRLLSLLASAYSVGSHVVGSSDSPKEEYLREVAVKVGSDIDYVKRKTDEIVSQSTDTVDNTVPADTKTLLSVLESNSVLLNNTLQSLIIKIVSQLGLLSESVWLVLVLFLLLLVL